MLCNNAPVRIKKLADCLLCQPYIVTLNTDFYAVLVSVFCNHKEIHCAVLNLQFVVFLFSHYVTILLFIVWLSSYIACYNLIEHSSITHFDGGIRDFF